MTVKYKGPLIGLDPVDLWCSGCGVITTRFFSPKERPTSLPCSTPDCEVMIRHSVHKPNLHARLLDYDLARKELEAEKRTQNEIVASKELNRELEEQQKTKEESDKQAELAKQKAKFKPKKKTDESGNPYYENFDGSRDYNMADADKTEDKPE